MGVMQRRGLPWWPALDGLRGLAVAAVLVFHHDPRWLPGGFLGVSLFFTLSGFLITSLLLEEHDRNGRIDLRAFWSRRVRRLLPASCVGLGLAAIAVIDAFAADQRGEVLRHGIAAALNVANWWAIDRQSVYGAVFGPQSPVEHFWSLAIEEQFYLVFPLVAVAGLRWGRRGLAVATGALALLSLGAALSMDAPNREYLGTDVRAAELLAGVALALVVHRRRVAERTRVPELLTVAALAGTVVLWRLADIGTAGLYAGGLAGVAVVSAVLVAGAISGGPVATLLCASWLRALGRISYGVYVVHLPLFVLLREGRFGLSGPSLLAVRAGVTVLAAAASYAVLERRVRYGPRLVGLRAPGAYATALASVVVLLAAVAAVGPRLEGDGEPVFAARPPPAAPAVGAVPAVLATSTTGVPAAPAPTAAPVTPAPRPARAVAPPPATTAPPRPPQPLRLLLVGDSTAEANARGFATWAARSGVELRSVTRYGSVVLSGDAVRYREGWVEQRPDGGVIERGLAAAAEFRPDAVVVFIGSAQLGDWRLAGDEQWRWFGDDSYERSYAGALDVALGRLDLLGLPVLWPSVLVPAWQPERQGIHAGSGPITLNDPVRTRRLNDLTTSVVSRHPNVRVVPFAERLAPDGTVPEAIRPDGLHLTGEAVDAMLGGWLADQLRSDYRAVFATPGARLHAPRATAWSP